MEKLRRQAIKAVLDLLLLAELKNSTLSGYDAMSVIHNKFGVLISSGTVYSHLYALERDNLIKGDWEIKKRVYDITEKGTEALDSMSKSNKELLGTLKSVLTP